MGRPPLDPGTYGKITAYEVEPGVWEARCKYRTLMGRIIKPSKRGPTEKAAERALKKHIIELAEQAAHGIVSPDSYLRDVAPLWLKVDIEHEVDEGALSDGTRRTYDAMVRNHIVKQLGDLRMRELEVSVTACDKMIKGVRTALSYESATTCKTVLDSICAFAIRHGGMTHNPVRSVSRLRRGVEAIEDEVEAMSDEQVEKMLESLEVYGRAKMRAERRARPRAFVWGDLRDQAEAMLATGVRIGEVLACGKQSLTKDQNGRPAVRIDHHLVPHRGKGIVRKYGRKGNKPGILLTLPEFAVPIVTRRALAAAAPDGPLFPSADGTWLDPSNASKRLREALDDSGYDWVTPHMWRRTVGRILNEAGLTITEIAEQLGITRRVVEKHYVPRKSSNAKQAAALHETRTKSAGKVTDAG